MECVNCLLRKESTPGLKFNKRGLCSECARFNRLRSSRWQPESETNGTLDEVVERIRRSGADRPYDCLLGVSGGVDSSYLALRLKDFGLRVLAVHVDNGWNTPVAARNISAVLDHCGFDLSTVILETNSFYDLQKSFLRASVPDIEIPTDHAIQAVLWSKALENSIPTIVSGMNFSTESSSLEGWTYGHNDWRYISDVWKKFGQPNPELFPHYSLSDLLVFALRGHRIVSLLNYMSFNPDEAIERLTSTTNWQPYPEKHGESVYTRWAQGKYLPEKFGLDKRVLHVSDKIRSGNLGRAEAMDLLERTESGGNLGDDDQAQVLRRFGWDSASYEIIKSKENRSYRDFRNSKKSITVLKFAVLVFRRLGLYFR